MNELALFAGAGGGILGGKLLRWRTVCAVEYEPYAASVLVARQNDGLLPPFPVWDDVRTFDGRPWRGRVDVVSGGFPCQDISAAGKGEGITGEKSGLWMEMARIIGEVRPRYVFVENSPMLTSRGLGVVLGDLAAMGFDARWGVLGAADVGSPHLRERIWIVAYDPRIGRGERRQGRSDLSSAGESEQSLARGRWPTPRANDAEKRGQVDTENPRNGLVGAVQKFPTPQSRDWKGSSGRSLKGEECDLPTVAGGSLNADWVEWLMGWPIGWTRLESIELREEHWDAEPEDIPRTSKSFPGRLKAIGNGQVPQCAAEAWRQLSPVDR